MKLFLDETDIHDSIYVYEAHLLSHFPAIVEPEDIDDVTLIYNHEEGFSAQAVSRWGESYFEENDVIRAVAHYLSHWYNFNSEQLIIQLEFDEHTGFSANITVLR